MQDSTVPPLTLHECIIQCGIGSGNHKMTIPCALSFTFSVSNPQTSQLLCSPMTTLTFHKTKQSMPRDSFWSKYNFAVLGLDCIALDNTRNYMYSIYACTAHAHRLLQPMYLIHTCSRTKLQDTITSGIIYFIQFFNSFKTYLLSRHPGIYNLIQMMQLLILTTCRVYKVHETAT